MSFDILDWMVLVVSERVFIQIVSMLLHKRLSVHLLQIGNLDFLRISAALLCFYAGLQVDHKAQIRLDEQNGQRIIYRPMRIVPFFVPRIFCKNAEKPVAVIIRTESAGRRINIPSVGRKIAESSRDGLFTKFRIPL